MTLKATIPTVTIRNNHHNVPGWSDYMYVTEKHDVARHAFFDWLSDGKPRCGPSFQLMLKSRAAFKQALRFCKRHKVQLQAYALAYSYKNSDSNQFGKKISDISNSKATAHVNKIGDIGEENICSMWCILRL